MCGQLLDKLSGWDCVERTLKALSMRMRGLEPPRDCSHSVLSAARLPVPPHPRWKLAYYWPGKMLSSNRAFQSEFFLNLAQRGDHERAMFIEAQPQFFGAAPQVVAVDRSGEGLSLIRFFTDETSSVSKLLSGRTSAQATRNPHSSSVANIACSMRLSRLTPV